MLRCLLCLFSVLDLRLLITPFILKLSLNIVKLVNKQWHFTCASSAVLMG